MATIRQTIATSVRRFIGIAGESFAVNTSVGLPWKSRTETLGEYNGLIRSSIQAIAEEYAKYEPEFYKKDRQGKLTPTYHTFGDVLENPNPTLSKFDLLESTISYLELVGDAFWYYELGARSREPKAIYELRPDRVEIFIDKAGDVIGYTYLTDAGTKIPLDVDEVEHHKTFNPRNRYRGIGTVQANIIYVETEKETSKFQYKFLKNQASPSGIVSLKGNITKEAFNKLKRQWAEKQAGAENAGKTLFIRETEASFAKVGLSLGDLDMAALKAMTEEKIFKAFRVPKFMLGDFDQTGLGRSNIEAGMVYFTSRVIDPKQIRLDDVIQRCIRRNYKDTDIVVKHVSQIPEDREAELNEIDKGVNRWITVNEVREKKGLDPIDGGDKLYVNFNQSPITDEEDDDAGASNDNDDTPPPTDDNTDNDDEETTDDDTTDEDTEETKSLGTVKIRRRVVVKKDTAETAFFNQVAKIEATAEKQYNKEIKKLLKKQLEYVLDKASAYGADTKAYEEATPDEGEEAKEWAIILAPLLINAMTNGGVLALEYLDVTEIEFIVSQAQRDAIFESTERLLKSFNRETTLKIQKAIAIGVENGETTAQIAKRIEAVYKEAMGFRATRIAATEAHKATNAGLYYAYKAAGVKQVEWVAELDDKTCEYCRAMHGTIVDIGVPFVPKGGTMTGEDGGERLNDYEDIYYADAHPNCRCKLRAVRQ